MLRQARLKLPGVSLVNGDLRDFCYEGPFDAILCLCSSIAYLRSNDELVAAFSAFARSLRPGGVALIRPWLDPELAVDGSIWMDSCSGDGVSLCRQAVLRKHGRDSILDFHWLIAKPETGVMHHCDRHVLRLFEDREIEQALAISGMRARRSRCHGFEQPLWLAARPDRSWD